MFVVPEVLVAHEIPSVDMRIVPDTPTTTYKHCRQTSVVLSLKANDSKAGMVAVMPRSL